MSATYTVCTRVWLFACYTHTHPFNGPLSGTTRVSRYQKGKTNLDFTEARDSGWQWHQLGYMQVCAPLQTDNHTSTPPLFMFFTGRMPFLPPNQQRQSTEALFACYNGGIFYCSLRAGCTMMSHNRPLHSRDSGHIFSRDWAPSVTWCRIENRQVYDYLIVFKKS